MVCVIFPDLLLRSSLFVAELADAIRMTIPGIVDCVKDSDSDVRNAAISVLSALGKHGSCQPPSSVVALIPFCSSIPQAH